MFPPIDYLSYAQAHFGRADYDLATSGIPPISSSELLELASAEAPKPDDLEARARFRSAVAERYGVPEAEVSVALGGSGALFAACGALLRVSQTVLVETPGYQPLSHVPTALGARLRRFRRKRSGELDLDRVLDELSPDVAMVLISNPHNPSGTFTSDDALRELAAQLDPVVLVVDEAYRELAAPKTTARGLGPNVITVSSTTKCLGVPWPRSGWLLTGEDVTPQVQHLEHHVAGFLPPGGWGWGCLALHQADALLERAKGLLGNKREQVVRFVEQNPKLVKGQVSSRGTPFAFLRDARDRSLSDILEAAVASHSLLVSPGRFFGDHAGFRVSWTGSEERLEKGLERLAEVLA